MFNAKNIIGRMSDKEVDEQMPNGQNKQSKNSTYCVERIPNDVMASICAWRSLTSASGSTRARPAPRWRSLHRRGHHISFAESGNEGHPDKLNDQVWDDVLNTCLRDDAMNKVACETADKEYMKDGVMGPVWLPSCQRRSYSP